MATLITGAGLVGTSFATWALRRGERPVFFDAQPREEFLRIKLGDAAFHAIRGDTRDLPALLRAIADHEIDTIVHTAGLIGRCVATSLATAFEVNLGGTANVAEAARLSGVRRLVHVSSTGVYDWRRPTDRPVDESFPRGSGAPYANLNAAKELLLEAYARQHAFELVVIRSSNVIGLGHGAAGSGGTRKWRALAEAGLRGATAVLPASQAVANEYVSAQDLGRAIDRAATGVLGEERTFNVANGEITRFDALVAAAQKAMPGLAVEVEAGERPPERTWPVDVSRAARALHWTPELGVAEALEALATELRSVGLDRLDRLQH